MLNVFMLNMTNVLLIHLYSFIAFILTCLQTVTLQGSWIAKISIPIYVMLWEAVTIKG